MNVQEELNRLIGEFPEDEPLINESRHVAASQTPEPYKQMLVHEKHMTVTMESFHGCPVNVSVFDRRQSGDIYCRKIILTRSDNDVPVQFGIVRFHFEFVNDAVRDEILQEKTPLGRILINHNVLRHIDLNAIVEVQAGPGLAKYLQIPEKTSTYGRLATIFCNGQPAVDLLEISAPLNVT